MGGIWERDTLIRFLVWGAIGAYLASSGCSCSLLPLIAFGLSAYYLYWCVPPKKLDNASDWHVIVIGSGFSGINAGVRLAERGIKYTILEKDERLGGTWWENTYPGCACDVPSHLYSFSFYTNPWYE